MHITVISVSSKEMENFSLISHATTTRIFSNTKHFFLLTNIPVKYKIQGIFAV